MNDEATTTDGVQFSEAVLDPYDTAREAKRTYLKAVRKLRDAIAAGELTHAEGMTLRNEWAAGGEIPKEYLDGESNPSESA